MYFSHYKIIKYVGFESIMYAINMDVALFYNVFKEFDSMFVTPQFPGVPLTIRQPTETCGYRVPRYHTHMSHIL